MMYINMQTKIICIDEDDIYIYIYIYRRRWYADEDNKDEDNKDDMYKRR